MGVNLNDLMGGIDRFKSLTTANPAPLSRFERALRNAGRATCDAFAGDPETISGEVTKLTGRAALMGTACQPYWDSIGANGPSDYPPFSGGQCPVVYRYTAVGQDGSQTRTLEGFITGPIGARRVLPSGGTAADGTPGWNVRYMGGGGTETVVSFQNMRRLDAPTWRIVSAVRVDGNPDNCGDTPGGISKGTPPVNVEFGEVFIDTSTNLEIEIGPPQIDVNVDFFIPVNVGGIQVNFPGTDGSASESDPSGAPSPVDAAPAIPGGDLADNDGNFPPPPEGKEYVGAVFRMLEPPPGQPPIPNTTTQPVYPTVYGNFRLKLKTDNEVGVLSRNYRIREKESSIFRDDPGLTVIGAYASLKIDLLYEVIPLLINKPEA